mgnify:CR=1 FL=1
MRKNFGAKPYIYPQPVFIIGSYDENGVADAMNAAWGSIADYETIALYLSAGHKTVKNILNKKDFTLSMATEDEMTASDYVGIVSANTVPNKLEKTKWHISKSETIDAPIFEELPMTLECQLESYDEKTHLLLGKIINVSADERILDENDEIIGYEFTNLGRMMDMVKAGKDANEAIKEATGTYGRFNDAAKYIDPRKE